MAYFEVNNSVIAPTELVNAMERWANCNRYIDGLPDSDIKSDLNYVIGWAFNTFCNIAYDHGIEGADGLYQFFDGCDFSNWKNNQEATE